MSRISDPIAAVREWEDAFSSLFDAPCALRVKAWGNAVRSNAALQLAARKGISVPDAAALLMAVPAPNSALLPWRLTEEGMLETDWTDAFADAVADELTPHAKDVYLRSGDAPFFFPCAALHRVMRMRERKEDLERSSVMSAALDAFSEHPKKDAIAHWTDELNRLLDGRNDRTAAALAGALTLLLQKEDKDETILWR